MTAHHPGPVEGFLEAALRAAETFPGQSPESRDYLAAAHLAGERVADADMRIRVAGSVHNLAGDLGELLTKFTADDIGYFDFCDGVRAIEDDLECQARRLKAVSL